MENWITEIMEQYGYTGILFLIALENVFPPIPSEVILTFGGFMTTHTKLTITGVVWFSTLGSLIGAVIIYSIGYILKLEGLEKIVVKWGHIISLKKEVIYKKDAWVQNDAGWTMFILL